MNNTCPVAPSVALQPVWDALRSHDALLLSPFFPAFIAFAAHLAMSLPFLALDLLGPRCATLHRYRIPRIRVQPASVQVWWQCLLRIARKHLAVIVPVTLVIQRVRTPSLPAEAPSCARALTEVTLCLLLFDSLVPQMFQLMHSAHHQHRDTFALAAQDSSIWELLSLQVLALSITALLGCHPLSEVVFHLLNLWLAVEYHCGYDLPWATHRLVPFHLLGGAPFHQAHHQLLRGNYAPYFTHWDHLFGTYLEIPKDRPAHLLLGKKKDLKDAASISRT
nr:PREDICTED: cholesterol 25-hydroxylase-like protein [Lepisosteus oculatus]